MSFLEIGKPNGGMGYLFGFVLPFVWSGNQEIFEVVIRYLNEKKKK